MLMQRVTIVQQLNIKTKLDKRLAKIVQEVI
jgi:hypothetical protein